MKKSGLIMGMLGKAALAAVLAFGLVVSGCTINKAAAKVPVLERRIIPLAELTSEQYSILGTVKLEKNWFGILGFSVSSIGLDAYVFQNGGVTYTDLLAEAQKKYSDADAVVDINVDYQGSTYAVFYSQRKNIVSGIAIKYTKDPVL
jgi:hypothetical protein